MGSHARSLLAAGLLVVHGLVAACLPGVAASAQQPPLTTTRIASGLAKPLWAGTPPSDDRLFVIEQLTSRISIVGSDGLPQSPAFLDLSSLVLSNTAERGLLGLA